ncbi:hypothetical protein BLNAU_11176 [Blattamonas nauphoetae]|uniref:Uncharacterized protein n=1 Tax=Blattamonas nauphoetae TaxID=2049346 RepID=A0ABQ9XNB8_9EUKA|nr:hypothetical protein BLNAU_11176 [Blattamonas nauphoetae]
MEGNASMDGRSRLKNAGWGIVSGELKKAGNHEANREGERKTRKSGEGAQSCRMVAMQEQTEMDGCSGEKEKRDAKRQRGGSARLTSRTSLRLYLKRQTTLSVAFGRSRRRYHNSSSLPLSPHSSPNPAPTAFEGRTRLLLADLSGTSRSKHSDMQTGRRNTDTADLAACYEQGQLTTLESLSSQYQKPKLTMRGLSRVKEAGGVEGSDGRQQAKSPLQVITSALSSSHSPLLFCSARVRLSLAKADLVLQIINTLNPLSLSFTEAADIHNNLLASINHSLCLTTSDGLAQLGLKSGNEQVVHKTIFQEVLAPSEIYIYHLCENRYSIVDGDQSKCFMELLAKLVRICPYFQPTMGFVLHMPIFLTIPSCLTFFDDDESIWDFLREITGTRHEWNETMVEVLQLGKTVDQKLRMEGIEDVIEGRLRTDHKEYFEAWIVFYSIEWNHLLDKNQRQFRTVSDFIWATNTVCVIFDGSEITSSFATMIWILSHHPHPSSPLCLSLPTHTLPLPSASPSPPTPSHSPLPLPHHPHPSSPLCLSLPTHTLPLPLPLPPHPHPPTPLCLSLTTHTLPLPSASPSPLTPSLSSLPLAHHPHPPTPPLPVPHHPHPPTPLSHSLFHTRCGGNGRQDRTGMTERGEDTRLSPLFARMQPEHDRQDVHNSPLFIQPPSPSSVMTLFTARENFSSAAKVEYHFCVPAQQTLHALDVSLEAKAAKFLEFVVPPNPDFIYYFLGNLASLSDESLTDFVQSTVVLISSPSQIITTAAMKMLKSLIVCCSTNHKLALVKADLIPQLITTLNPHSLSFTETVDIHTCLLSIMYKFVHLATPLGLAQLRIEDDDEQQAVHETVLKQVLSPSEQYICYLCVIRYSIVDGRQCVDFVDLLATLLQISPLYQPTLIFFLNMPVVVTIPSCLTFFEYEVSIWTFLNEMTDAQRDWNKKRGEVQQMWNTVHRMLRMEGIEDVIEGKLRNDRNAYEGRAIVEYSIRWNNQLGMNLPRPR